MPTKSNIPQKKLLRVALGFAAAVTSGVLLVKAPRPEKKPEPIAVSVSESTTEELGSEKPLETSSDPTPIPETVRPTISETFSRTSPQSAAESVTNSPTNSNELESIRLKEGESPDAISLKPAESLEAVTLDSYEPPPPRKTPIATKSPRPSEAPETPPSPPARERLLSSTVSNKSPSSSPKTSSPTLPEDDDESPELPATLSQGQEDQSPAKNGQSLPLAKPYCFLLPKSSPAASECALNSVKLIVEEYAKAGVHVVPVFRWWGDDYSDNPSTLEKQATEACNLQKAFPWIKGGKQTASIQVFTRDPIPSIQCGMDYPKEKAAGCSNLCPTGSPSFSTVSEAQCSPSVALHESGHSNCCSSPCKNAGTCKPEVDAGCGLCLEPGGSFAANKLRRCYASKAPPGECKLNGAAWDSIRAGASPNPGYLYDPNRTYKPRGKKLSSIYSQKTGRIKKLLRGVGDTPDGDGSESGEGTPMAKDDGSSTSRKPASPPKKSQSNAPDEDPRQPLPNPSQYNESQVERMVDPGP